MTASPRHHRLRFWLDGQFLTLAVRCFGDRDAPSVLCVHGLTRNGHDFDSLAQTLSGRFHVITPDLPGRGDSDWLPDPMRYATPAYVMALSHVMAWIGREIFYVGTSLGGICGLELAAAPGSPIMRMVLNDLGPTVPVAALQRIKEYLCAPPPRFADIAALRLYLRRVHASFGPLTDAQWTNLATHSARSLPEGGVALHYDPAIAVPYAANAMQELDMWDWFERLEIPLLTLRGEHSDLLTEQIASRMQPRSRILDIPRTGHAPALLDGFSQDAIAAFLQA